MSAWTERLAVFDLETTGVDVDIARVVSACIAVLDGDGEVTDRWDWLADPGIEIPEAASDVHGITTERARAEGRPGAVVVAEIAQTLRMLFALGVPVTIYNAPYDLSVLDRECRRHEVPLLGDPGPVIDPLVLDKAVDRYRKGKRTLEAAAERYGVELEDAHDAGADAIAAGRVAQALAVAFPAELAVEADRLHRRQTVWYAEQAARFQDYIRRAKGDHDFVASTEWPVRFPEDETYRDTQPIPPLPPRASGQVPVIDFSKPIALQVAPAPDAADRAGDRAVVRVAAAIVVDADGRGLLVRKQGSTQFMQAGGKLEPGEVAIEALARELSEELGFELDPGDAEYLGFFRAEAAHEADAEVHADVFAVRVEGPIEPGAEIEELLWVDQLDGVTVELAPLTRDELLPLWASRRAAQLS